MDRRRANVAGHYGRRGDERCGCRRMEAVSRQHGRAVAVRRRTRDGLHRAGGPVTATPMPPPLASRRASAPRRTRLPLRTELAILLRLLAVQGTWNYETMIGNGIGFSIEPALRLLPGGIHSPEFKAALARQSKYFNAH